MSERAWKRTERAIAARIGGQRNPISGRARGDQPDIAHDVYSVEVKSRRKLPSLLRTAMAQAIAAQRGSQLPLVVLHEAGTRHTDDLILVRFGDWLAWFGNLVRPEGKDAG